MKAHQAEHTVTLMCEGLGLSRSGYYAWLSRPTSRHDVEDERLSAAILEEHCESKGIYGAPRIHARLARRGIRTSKKRVARIMRERRIVGVTRRSKYRTTTRDGTRPAPDLVERSFEADGPNQLWVADITHIPTRTQPLFLAMVLDVWSRKVVGWATATQMPAELVVDALEMAVARRKPEGVVHHSDQGSQYTSVAFTSRCGELNVTVSMGSVADCYDNAMAESFFATLEVELLRLSGPFANPTEADTHVFEFLEGFYNTRRLHSRLGYRSPLEFERAMSIHSSPQIIHSLSTGKDQPISQLPTCSAAE